METELTIKIDKNILDTVEKYTKEHKISISELIEKFFKSMLTEKSDADNIFEVTPFVKSMRTGINPHHS